MRLTGNFSFPRPERSDRSDRIFSACMLIFTLIILTILASHRLQAKKPGERHCYRDVCVTVLSIKEVKDILGKTVKLKASYYDDPSVDRFNANELTSNGERFSADDPTRTASSNFPDGTELLLRNPRNGLVSHVRVNDFGPFWGNRELDVTRRVAEDLGFAKDGLADLEVTIVAAPREDDVRALYRRNRKPIPTLGHLGVRSAEETVGLAKILLQRLPAKQQKIIFAKDRLNPQNAQTMVKRETVFHYVPKQTASPRALGAENFFDTQSINGERALEIWRVERQAKQNRLFYIIAWSTALLMLIFAGPIIGTSLNSLYRLSHHKTPSADADEIDVIITDRIRSGLITTEREELVKRRQIMKRHNTSFDENYTWPHLPMVYGSSRPPAERETLNFDIDYIWPRIEPNTLELLTDHTLSDVEGSANLTKELPDSTGDNNSSREEFSDLPPHERLRRRLDRIRRSFESSE